MGLRVIVNQRQLVCLLLGGGTLVGLAVSTACRNTCLGAGRPAVVLLEESNLAWLRLCLRQTRSARQAGRSVCLLAAGAAARAHAGIVLSWRLQASIGTRPAHCEWDETGSGGARQERPRCVKA